MSYIHDEEAPNPNHSSKRCKFLTSALKDAFSNCHAFRGKPTSTPQDDHHLPSDYDDDDDDDQELFVSVVRSKYMESKCRRKVSFTMDSFCWAFSPTTGELFIAAKAETQPNNGRNNDDDDGGGEEEEREDFFSVGSCLSRCSSAPSMESLLSVKTSTKNLSRCSSLNALDFPEFRRRRRFSIIQELCHCEGWPFGLCRKALLLPPLPKSPSDSWTWRKKC